MYCFGILCHVHTENPEAAKDNLSQSHCLDKDRNQPVPFPCSNCFCKAYKELYHFFLQAKSLLRRTCWFSQVRTDTIASGAVGKGLAILIPVVQPWADSNDLLQAKPLDCSVNRAMQLCCPKTSALCCCSTCAPSPGVGLTGSEWHRGLYSGFLLWAEHPLARLDNRSMWKIMSAGKRKFSSCSSHLSKLVHQNGGEPLPNLHICILGFMNNKGFYWGMG